MAAETKRPCISVRCSVEEKAGVEKAASNEGMNLTDYVRTKLGLPVSNNRKPNSKE